MDLAALRSKAVRYGIGMMSGSSCDGIDVALVRIEGTGPELKSKLGRFTTVPYADEFKSRLMARRLDAQELCKLNVQLGEFFASAACDMLKAAETMGCHVHFIASHGHTIAHMPPRTGTNVPGTLQIAEPAIIAEQTGLPVISDFRQRDMAAGGQGAPLVPYVDWLLFHRPDRTVGCLNIGGIANITVVTPELDKVTAFDTGPGNMAIDGAVRFLTAGKQQMDEDGAMAARGNVVSEFLEYLLEHAFFGRQPPKSTGREEFGAEVYLHDALAARKDGHPVEDLVATVTAAVAYSIIQACNRYVTPQHRLARVIISGGGAANPTLVNRIAKGLTDSVVRTSDEYGIPSGAREAISFAILGNEAICGTPANVPSATGARQPVVLGKVTPV